MEFNFLSLGTSLPNFFDDFSATFPYLSKIRKTFQEYGVAFFLLDALANRKVGESDCDEAGSLGVAFVFEGSAYGTELIREPLIMESYGVTKSREYGIADH